MNNKTVYVVNGGYNDIEWTGLKQTNDIESANAIFFTGGSDIQTSRYNEKRGKYISDNPERDEYEFDLFNKSKKNQLKIGVCRGGQHLTVANGFRLVQHMKHPGYHDVHTFDNKTILASSTHHNQFLLNPNNLIEPSKFTLLGWTNKLSPYHLNGENKDYNFPQDYKEPEIVLYESEKFGKSISIQMHPEFFEFEHDTNKYLRGLINNYI